MFCEKQKLKEKVCFEDFSDREYDFTFLLCEFRKAKEYFMGLVETSMWAKSVPVPLCLNYINATSHSLELINITILKDYKYLMSCLPQLRFIL